MRAMSETTNNPSNTTAADEFDGHSVIAVSFEDDGNAYKALTLLGELGSRHRIGVQEAVVVARGEDGQVVAKDRLESSSVPGAATGGLLGLLIGIIGGPLGVLVGGTYGLFVGSLFDIYDADAADSALGAISSSAKVGHAALLAVVDEPSTEIVDAAMSDVGGTIARGPLADVEAEIAAAEDAERKAKREARKELHRAHRDRDKAAVNAKVEELKASSTTGSRPKPLARAERSRAAWRHHRDVAVHRSRPRAARAGGAGDPSLAPEAAGRGQAPARRGA